MESSCTDDVNALLGMMTEHADDPSVQATAAGALARRFDAIWPRGCKDAAMPDEVCGCVSFLTFEVRDCALMHVYVGGDGVDNRTNRDAMLRL